MSGYENLGPNVSQNPQAVAPGGGGFSAEDRSYDSVVFQQNRPPMDWEWNLFQSMLAKRNGLRSVPSGFLTGDFSLVDTPNGGVGQSYGFLAPDPGIGSNANKFTLAAADLVVNGWPIRLEYTETNVDGSNLVVLPPPPLGGARTDLVIMEVWRALISPSPSTDNKSPSGQILRHGNAKASDGFPLGNVNLSDDLVDPSYGNESARRVQIQYRLRTVQNVDLTSYADALGDPLITANTVPYLFASPVDGNPTAFPYVQHSSDPGLWVAGTGDAPSAGSLGTVDGYMYAIPVCAVFRRNTNAFDRSANLNGGLAMTSPTSDRPDGLFADQIIAEDVLDLRKTSGRDLSDLLEKGFKSVLKGTSSTTFDTSGLGTFGPTLTMRDSTGAGHIGDTDGARVVFSDRATVQAVVTATVNAAPYSSVTLNLGSLPIPWNLPSLSNVKAKAPTGTSIVGVSKVRVVTATNDYNAFDPVTSPVHITSVAYSAAPGPAVDQVVITFSGSFNPSTCYVELLLEYPSGCGLSRNVLDVTDVWVPAALPVWADVTKFYATSDANRKSCDTANYYFDGLHREVSLVYPAQLTATTFRASQESATTIFIPERVDPSSVSITVPAGTVVNNVSSGTAYTTVTFTPPAPIAPGAPVTATYICLRPAPETTVAPNDSVDFFYWSRARQSLIVPAGVRSLKLIPKVFGQSHIIVAGSGTPGSSVNSFIKSPGTHIPISRVPAPSEPESIMDCPEYIPTAIGTYSNLSYLTAPTLVPMEYDPYSFRFYNDGTPTLDGDGRSYWPFVEDATSDLLAYFSCITVNSPAIRRKIVYPFIAELAEDFQEYGRKGTLVLAILTHTITYSNDNVAIVSKPPYAGEGCAAVYRLRGNPISTMKVNS